MPAIYRAGADLIKQSPPWLFYTDIVCLIWSCLVCTHFVLLILSFWTPGPNLGIHYVAYFINGFPDLQDMIDHGITRATADIYGDSVTARYQGKVPKLGYYLQPMPYPCYESDT